MKRLIAVVVTVVFVLGFAVLGFAADADKCGSCHKGDKALDKIVKSKNIDALLDKALGEEMARYIEHEPSPEKSGLVFYADSGKRPGDPRDRLPGIDLRRKQLTQRLDPIKEPGRPPRCPAGVGQREVQAAKLRLPPRLQARRRPPLSPGLRPG